MRSIFSTATSCILIVLSVIFLTGCPSPEIEVLDCSEEPKPCALRSIDRYHHCPERKTTSCVPLTDGIEDISYISVPYNYVTGQFSSEQYDVVSITGQIDRPWGLDFLPSGDILVTLQDGHVVLVRDGQVILLGELDVLAMGEVGLMGVAVDPHFDQNRYVYFLHTYATDPGQHGKKPKNEYHLRVFNRVVRYTLQDEELIDEHTILEKIPGSLAHGGGQLVFGPDGKLFATTGDGNILSAAQDLEVNLGKILRLNKDGSVPANNPFPGSYVYSYGHRNSQGLAWNPRTGSLYNSEHGQWRYDEVNRIAPGGNYGWGNYRCDEKSGHSKSAPDFEFTAPVMCFKTWTMAPSGIDFEQDPQSPWYGNLFIAGLKGSHLRRVEIEEGRVIHEEIFFIAGDSKDGQNLQHNDISLRLRAVKSHGGSLYVLGDRYGLIRIDPPAQSAVTHTL